MDSTHRLQRVGGRILLPLIRSGRIGQMLQDVGRHDAPATQAVRAVTVHCEELGVRFGISDVSDDGRRRTSCGEDKSTMLEGH